MLRAFIARTCGLGVLIASLFVTSTITRAQVCDGILKYGIYDTSAEKTDRERAASFRRVMCQQNFSSSSEAKDFGAAFGIPIGDLPFSFSGSAKTSEFQEAYSSYCDDTKYDAHSRDRTETLIRRINPLVVDAWKSCVGSAGLHAWISQSGEKGAFQIHLRFVPLDRKHTTARVLEFTAKNATCEPLKNVAVGPEGYQVRCTRLPEDGTDVLINATTMTLWNTPTYIAPFVVPAPPAPRKVVVIPARDYVEGKNVAACGDVAAYGCVVGNAPGNPGGTYNMAEWSMTSEGGSYEFWVEYAAKDPRPVSVYIDGDRKQLGLTGTTGGWRLSDQQWTRVGVFDLPEGKHRIRFDRPDVFPHILTLKFSPQ